MPPLGSPPNYSTRRTLGFALLSMLAGVVHGSLGAADYPAARYLGLAYMLLAGLLLVYGIILLIRYLEALDAMTDPVPRAPMYRTPHERSGHVVGLGLHVVAVAVALAWAVDRQVPLWHLVGVAISLYAIRLALQSRPAPDE
ncbi:hypothetical protein [Deinococcus sonorensis]|uniref:Integral membrane protein n=2 Tax=Deinococcus sonorensis TaxID=309891 RepID=A0AAU7UB72_9DEIO